MLNVTNEIVAADAAADNNSNSAADDNSDNDVTQSRTDWQR